MPGNYQLHSFNMANLFGKDVWVVCPPSYERVSVLLLNAKHNDSFPRYTVSYIIEHQNAFTVPLSVRVRDIGYLQSEQNVVGIKKL